MSLILWCPDQTLCRCQTSSFSLSRFWPVCCFFFFFAVFEHWETACKASSKTQNSICQTARCFDPRWPPESQHGSTASRSQGWIHRHCVSTACQGYLHHLSSAQHSFFPPSLSLLLSLLTYAIWWARSLQCSQRIRLLEREGFPSESRTSNPASEPSSRACHQPILLYVSAARWNYVRFIYQTSSSTCSPGLRFLNLRIVI